MVGMMHHAPRSALPILVAAVAVEGCANATPPGRAEAGLERGLGFAMSKSGRGWHDPHGLVMIGTLQPFILARYGRATYDRWLSDVTRAVCVRTDEDGVATSGITYAYYPEVPECLSTTDGHETAIALLGMSAAGIDKLDGASADALVAWLKLHPDHDEFSIGLRIQPLLLWGVAVDDGWTTADGRSVTTRSLLDAAVTEWRQERDRDKLQPGDVPSDLLLHLGHTLAVLEEHHPDVYEQFGYDEVLDEVFAFYESILVDGRYWGFPGETFATGHIIENYAMDGRPPPSLACLDAMIDKQERSGKFDLGDHDFFAAQVHGLKGIDAAMRAFGYGRAR